MDRQPMYETHPRSLAALLDVGGRDPNFWMPGELKDVLRHQLRAPLLFDLKTVDREGGAVDGWKSGSSPAGRAGRSDRVSTADPPPASFGDLLHHPRPPLELLRLTKEFAKASDSRSDNPLPPEVATVLYYAAILVALVRHGRRITALSDSQLLDGLDWVLQQPWLDGRTRDLFAAGRVDLESAGTAR